ncbi:hypothetical protein LCGC14_2961720, partial [marine sediment metagenome]
MQRGQPRIIRQKQTLATPERVTVRRCILLIPQRDRQAGKAGPERHPQVANRAIGLGLTISLET